MASIQDEVVDLGRETQSPMHLKRKSTVAPRAMSLQVPNIDNRKTLAQFSRRNQSEAKVDYRRETILDSPDYQFTYKPNDIGDLLDRHPSYRKFRIPFEMICGNRYVQAKKSYEAQLRHEVGNIIDFQRTAADACYFVRCMAITSFWPPLHHMTEVKNTSKNFFQLSAKERWRLQIIMDTDIT